MTNAEKYKEIFGFLPDPVMCPTCDCRICPCSDKDDDSIACIGARTHEWWNSEYKMQDMTGELPYEQ